jgi:hypothetical protein
MRWASSRRCGCVGNQLHPTFDHMFSLFSTFSEKAASVILSEPVTLERENNIALPR